MSGICGFEGCTEPAGARGLCNTHYTAHRRRQIAYGRWEHMMIDATPAREHLHRLVAAGVGKARIAKLCSLNSRSIALLAQGTNRRIRRDNAATILAVAIPKCPFGPEMAEGARIDPTGTVRRLRALAAVGWSRDELARRLDLPSTLALKDLYRGSRKNVTVGIARRVAALYLELQEKDGGHQRTRAHAERAGWVPPIAWSDDEIDDPAAKHHLRGKRPQDAMELYRDYLDLGITDEQQIAERMGGVKPKSVQRALIRLKKKDTAA
ncbi:Uncharacterised protein [Mycobacteroides abscessus subsp. massiliense]|uniref:hypothetical protein n=1 Tax=Mycobacteroides abscessus TaxID=36809 RepID=UPI0009A61D18|nr:hypothetical protein [Mycobacteroides abscessus]SKM82467.1 Uncharacterised protein [Mycobacteroides abscessus subsp. massiliense]SKM99221.1 Uncharacterised protein [Mycobacteroides abscessus subsp. massiliense]SKN77818.1 Uncharacterised protein [Mycobacteroides abscessus subsp. massiliense]SKN95492.1 Uncharacterised protein [Mycobacteroides abscessus subsp. massiliense]SKO23038.1 Uncharacterised protein [Mycobacteroides abscessus subsp. massiliense]